ncbi:posterior protein-like [Xenopus laevis]|uniref:Posterior protein-like n=2 Tax=Xenopus laevis TaxID=8355 RepID=A0A1L8EPW3_XENLA|nr:posterior protein-like [Xenopus laevis]OCT61377.1 hypothetical protein XELAEV_18047400mg [Xenopus laevis]
MEVAQSYITKYASAKFVVCTNDPLTHQFNDIFKQCVDHNEALKSKQSNKKGKKERISNILSMLFKMKDIAEKKELEWYTERVQLREELDKFGQSLSVAVTSSGGCECDDLKDEVDRLIEQNYELEEKLEECEEMCRLREQQLSSLENKEGQKEEVILSLNEQLTIVKAQLIEKEKCIQLLKPQEGVQHSNKCEFVPVCTLSGEEEGEDIIRSRKSTSLFTPQTEGSKHRSNSVNVSGSNTAPLTIQDRTNLCQILGKFDTSASPISLSNKLEAVVSQYNLNNKDACSLLRAWLPYQLAAQLKAPVGTHKGVSADLNTNWGSFSERLQELQRIMGGRDARGTNALENTKLKKGEDPILFCNEYLAMYKATYNCPDMSPDDSAFLYSMSNKCTFIDFSTRVALRNANSYQTFLNILKDWIEEAGQDSKMQRKVFEVIRNEGPKRFNRKCYSCGNTGHFSRDCRVPKKRYHKTENRRPGQFNAASDGNRHTNATLYAPLLQELQKMKVKIVEEPEEYKKPVPNNPYIKQ